MVNFVRFCGRDLCVASLSSGWAVYVEMEAEAEVQLELPEAEGWPILPEILVDSHGYLAIYREMQRSADPGDDPAVSICGRFQETRTQSL